MGKTKISELPWADTPSGQDAFPVVEGGTTVKSRYTDPPISQEITKNISNSKLRPYKDNKDHVLVLIGDSITMGLGATDTGIDDWAGILMRKWNADFNLLDKEIHGALGILDTYGTFWGVTATGSVSKGTTGPARCSLIMQPGSTMEFTGLQQYVGVTYQRSPGAGKLEFWEDAVLLATFDCSGSALNDASTWGLLPNFSTSTSTARKIKCIDAAVEVTSLYQLHKPSVRIIQMRLGVGGETTAHFNNASTLDSIKKYPLTFASVLPKTYIISLGSNDIYSVPDAVPLADYISNLTNMINVLRSDSGASSVDIYIPVPPVPVDTIPVQNETFEEYKRAIYRLSQDLVVGLIDHSAVDYVDSALYDPDGVHPNDSGYLSMADTIYSNFVGTQREIKSGKDFSHFGIGSKWAMAGGGDADGGFLGMTNLTWTESGGYRVLDKTKKSSLIILNKSDINIAQAPAGTDSPALVLKRLCSIPVDASFGDDIFDIGDPSSVGVNLVALDSAALMVNCYVAADDTYRRTNEAKSAGFIVAKSDGTFVVLTAGPGTGAISFTTHTIVTSGNITAQNKIASGTKTGTSTGTAGQTSYDSSYLYVCTATNTWKRIALTAF